MASTIQLVALLLVLVSTISAKKAGTNAKLRGDTLEEDGLQKGCIDLHMECKNWSSTGECKKNPTWMMPNCPVSCNLCVGGPYKKGCIDLHSECSNWATTGECKENPKWMMPNCPVSCDLCGKKVKCVDLYRECAGWEKDGECAGNDVWMFFNCPKTCGTCDQEFVGFV